MLLFRTKSKEQRRIEAGQPQAPKGDVKRESSRIGEAGEICYCVERRTKNKEQRGKTDRGRTTPSLPK